MELTSDQKKLINRILLLKKEKNAIILCHNYQRPEIYEVADFVGDSLELCRQAKKVNAKLIVFSGVYFMAESAAILNPRAKVVIPSCDAGCALSDMLSVDDLKREKAKYPDVAVVCYINSSAAVKAESDACCTSSNAVDIIQMLPQKRILFVPDKNLANFVAKQVPEKEIIAWDGYCPIHQRLTPEYLLQAKAARPGAEIIAHPECTPSVRAIADYVVSTSGMLRVAQTSKATDFICTTECGMVQRLKQQLPQKRFFTVCSVCFDMKKNTLELIEESLKFGRHEIVIPDDIRMKALKAFEKMFEIMNYKQIVKNLTEDLLKSDLGEAGDITSERFFKRPQNAQAKIVARQSGICAGMEEIKYFLEDRDIEADFLKKDGEKIKKDDVVCVLKADIKEILKVERIVLNLLGRMSGIASFTKDIVDKARKMNPLVRILPTRKTLWGQLDKRACSLGGGGTHRNGLYDAILIKDNHLASIKRNITSAIRRFFPSGRAAAKDSIKFIEIEVENQREALLAAQEFKKLKKSGLCRLPCYIMLDNVSAAELKKTLSCLRKKDLRNICGIEVSGGITGKNIVEYAKTEVDVISMGCLTHSAPMMDFSLEI